MSMTLKETVAALEKEIADRLYTADALDKKAESVRTEVGYLRARVQGIKEAQEALKDQFPDAVETPDQRRPRRDIRALVKEHIANKPADCRDPNAIAAAIGCKAHQVRKALAAIQTESGGENWPVLLRGPRGFGDVASGTPD